MSRVQKFGRSNRSKKAAVRAASPASEEKTPELPPRRKKFPSSAQKVSKWFYNLLFVLFVGLVVFLFWYGKKFS